MIVLSMKKRIKVKELNRENRESIKICVDNSP